jgi:hypothetical protein
MASAIEFFFKKYNNIIIAVIFILIVISYFSILGINFNISNNNEVLRKKIIIETLDNNTGAGADNTGAGADNTGADVNLDADKELDIYLSTNSFKRGICSKKPNDIQKYCKTLNEKNCNIPSCCIWLSVEDCVAGNKNGPFFNKKDGTDIDVDVKYYFYKNKLIYP